MRPSLCICGALLVVLASNARPAYATGNLQGKVVAITDGDTLVVLVGRDQVKVRLYGIDAPEKRQAYGDRARQHLSDCAFGKLVVVARHGQDRYGRTLGDVRVNGASCNLGIVRAGLAWWYRKFAPRAREFADAEAHARRRQLGLWRESAPEPPWDFRKRPRRAGVPAR